MIISWGSQYYFGGKPTFTNPVFVPGQASYSFSGVSYGTSSASGIMICRGRIAGSANGQATVAAAIFRSRIQIQGAAYGQSSASGNMISRGRITGSSYGTGTVPGAVFKLKFFFSGVSYGTSSTGAATMISRGRLSGVSFGRSNCEGIIRFRYFGIARSGGALGVNGGGYGAIGKASKRKGVLAGQSNNTAGVIGSEQVGKTGAI